MYVDPIEPTNRTGGDGMELAHGLAGLVTTKDGLNSCGYETSDTFTRILGEQYTTMGRALQRVGTFKNFPTCKTSDDILYGFTDFFASMLADMVT